MPPRQKDGNGGKGVQPPARRSDRIAAVKGAPSRNLFGGAGAAGAQPNAGGPVIGANEKEEEVEIPDSHPLPDSAQLHALRLDVQMRSRTPDNENQAIVIVGSNPQTKGEASEIIPPSVDDPPSPPPPNSPNHQSGSPDGASPPSTPSKPSRLKTGTIVCDVFDVRQLLGRGGFGNVYRVRSTVDDSEYALKQVKALDKKGRLDMTIFREIALLRKTRDNPNLMSGLQFFLPNVPNAPMNFRDTFDGFLLLADVFDMSAKDIKESPDEHAYILMDLVSKDLAKRLDFPEPHESWPVSSVEVKELFSQLLNGISHLHSLNLIHRDLKPSNILLSKDGKSLKIGDFGLVRKFHTPALDYTPGAGTPLYRAPESVLGVRNYGPAVDIWSAGCILGELIKGEIVFNVARSYDTQASIITKMITILGFPTRTSYPAFELHLVHASDAVKTAVETCRIARSPPTGLGRFAKGEALELLKSLLSFDPSRRPSAADALKHPFLTAPPPAPPALTKDPKENQAAGNANAKVLKAVKFDLGGIV